MPIRFRCAYCNQLMGIARRKAGMVVRCPTCAGQVVVPNPEAGDEEMAPQPQEQPQRPERAKPDLFERSSFGEDFLSEDEPDVRSTAGRRAGFPPVPPPANPPPCDREADAEHHRPQAAGFNGLAAPTPPGIFLTPAKVTILAVLVVLLIGVAFFAGMLVGRS